MVNKMATTQNGYDLYELLSALQKCIRRGLEYDAVYFAVELEEFNSTALWNRLKVIASEDIGCANPIMPILIDILEKQYLKAKEKSDDSNKLFLTNAIVCLCRSPHSRITDDLYNVVKLENKRLPIPDYALDMHTYKGKSKGRGIEHFYSEGCKLENETLPNPYIERAKELRKAK